MSRSGSVPRRQFLGAALAASGALFTSRCFDDRRAGRPAAGRPLRHPIPSDPLPLDLTRLKNALAETMAHLVSDSLVWYDQRLEPIPRVARRWAWSADHRTLTFELRDDVLWHDGEPVTSGDVLYTHRALTDPAAGLPDAVGAFGAVRAVEAPDRRTVRVTYDEPFAPAVHAWTMPLASQRSTGNAARPIGCGPWTIERWDRGERLRLSAFAGYYSGPPGLTEVDLEVLGDYSTRYAALRSGRADIVTLSPELWRQFQQDPDLQRRCRVLRYRPLYFWYIAWRCDGSNRLFDDARARRALTLAVDRRGYLDRIAHGLGHVGVTSFHPDLWGADRNLAPWPYDPEAAQRLLRAAGWTPGADGVLARGGAPFRFTLMFPQTAAENQRLAEFVQANLRAVGVVMDLEPLEWAVFQERLRARRFEALMMGRSLEPDPDPFDLWHSSSRKAGGGNHAGFADREVDSWIEAARVAFDRAEREQLYQRIARRLHEAQPMMVFFYPENRVAVPRDLEGLEVCPRGLLTFWPGLHAWRWTTTPREGET